VANSRNPADFELSKEFLSLEPYGIMLRKDDPAFQKVADNATAQLYKSGKINAIYEKWFQKPIPPKGITLNVPMSEQLKKIFANPTHTGDPKAYE
jgi:glutamate/aspartate transport system substrate-binding protein